MSERITSIVLDTVSSDTKSRVEFAGVTQEVYDGRITKLTGLEAPSLNVTGGAASFGGSVFTGITLGDREVVISVKPSGSTNKQIKSRLNSLIGRSSRYPLNFEVNTEDDEGEVYKLRSDAYISNVSAPIFDKSDEIQITVKMPTSYLTREPIGMGGYAGDSEPVPISLRRTHISGGYHSIGYSIPLDLSSSALISDSPFSVNFRLSIASSAIMSKVSIRDGDMNKVIYNTAGVVLNSGLERPYFIFEYDGQARRVSAFMRETGASSSVLLREEAGYSHFVEPSWPRVDVATESIDIDLEMYGNYVDPPLDAIYVERVVVWPRVLGV